MVEKSKIDGFNARNFILELVESRILTAQELQFIHQFASHPEVFSTNDFFTWNGGKNSRLDFYLKKSAVSSGKVIRLINFYRVHSFSVQEMARCYAQLPKPLFLKLIKALMFYQVISPDYILALSIQYYDLDFYDELKQFFDTSSISYQLSDALLSQVSLLKTCQPDQLSHLGQMIRQLLSGFYILTEEGSTAAPFILAALHDEKKTRYEIQAPFFILRGTKEEVENLESMKQFLSLVARLPRPVKERFITSDTTHFRSGEIEIDEKGDVKIFIADSEASDQSYAEISSRVVLGNLNLQHFFPNQTVDFYYLCGNDRQHTGGTCGLFPFDDLKKLYTIELYDPGESLFKQLDDRVMGDTQNEFGLVIHLCQNPPTLHRSMQSRQIFLGLSVEDRHRIINKKNQNTIESIESNFVYDENHQPVQNNRIDIKRAHLYDTMNRFFLEHIAENPATAYQRITDLAHAHTIAGYCEIKEQEILEDQLKSISFGT